MLWSQFSAIFAIFREKMGAFLKNQCSDHIFQKKIEQKTPIFLKA
jgi:hypothetical protein